MRVTKILGKSFELWIANPIIILPFLLQIASYLILVIPFTLFTLYPQWNNLATSNVEAIANQVAVKVMESQTALLWFVILAIAVVLISCFLLAGSIGIANKICNGRKASFEDIIGYGKKFWFSYLATSFIVGGAILFALLIGGALVLVISMFGISEIIVDIVVAVLAIFLLLFAVALIPATNLVIMEGISPIEAIKLNFRFSRKNYLSILGLICLLVLVNALTNFVPFAGEIIGFLIVNPIQTIAIVLLIIDRMPALKHGLKQKNKK